MGVCICKQKQSGAALQNFSNDENIKKDDDDDKIDKFENGWICLKTNINYNDNIFSNPIVLDDELFIVSWSSKYNEITFEIYDILKNRWNHLNILPFNQKFESMPNHICLDEDEQLIYCYEAGINPKMVIIDLYEKSLKQYPNNMDNIFIPSFGTGSRCIVINSQYHLIGGSNNIHHFIWNICGENTKTFEKMHVFNNLQKGFTDFGLIYIKSQNKLIVFGGIEAKTNRYIDKMWSYSFNTNIWNELNIKIPVKLAQFGYVLTSNDQYILVFGGKINISNYSHNIYIFDTVKMEWYKPKQSKIELPKNAIFDAVINKNDIIHLFEKCGDKHHWKIDAKQIINAYNIELVFGYIKWCWIQIEFHENIFLSNDIINIIHQFYG